MKKVREFKNLLVSEIKKAEKKANEINNADDCKVTGYSVKYDVLDGIPTGHFLTVACEICHNYEERADKDVVLHIFMMDRRMSWAGEY